MPVDSKALEQTLAAARQRLLQARAPAGHWEGELSGSPLSTATAVCALALLDRACHAEQSSGLTRRGLAWLAKHQNPDGGWGDTPGGPSNISTTTLCWAACGMAAPSRPCSPSPVGVHDETRRAAGFSPRGTTQAEARVGWHGRSGRESAGTAPNAYEPASQRAEDWLKKRTSELRTACEPQAATLARAIGAVYGDDRTFSIPILATCALAGRFGTGRAAWRSIPALPFELAACPHAWFRWLGLPVVSYALPALIAIGQARHYHRPTRNPLTRFLRFLARGRTLRILQSIQPESGGFLEATPLTSFVVMGLVSAGQRDHPVVKRGSAFLTASVRDDGSWPIDTNLATWVTTLSVEALAGGAADGLRAAGRYNRNDPAAYLSADEGAALQTWLLSQQHHTKHPYTHAPPGGWAWTDLSGGVPDADDTSGALIALWHLKHCSRSSEASADEPSAATCRKSRGLQPARRFDALTRRRVASGNLAVTDEADRAAQENVRRAAAAGVRWLLDLQNRDGGIPAFCRGWGKLPFDRSSPDLTAHALRAWHAWRETLPDGLRDRTERAIRQAVRYLIRVQLKDGSWVPLWFGNQQSPNQESPLYGTTRVLRAGEVIAAEGGLGDAWRRTRQRGLDWVVSAQNPDGGWGGAAAVPSSIEETALAVEALAGAATTGTELISDSIGRGCAWLIQHTEHGTRFDPAPIGLYFARLWYFERLYPLIFTVAALERVRRLQTTV